MQDHSHRYSILVITTLASFMTAFASSSVNVALPSIGRELGMNAVELSWISTALLLATAVFLVPFGRIADIVGRKKIFTLGIVLYTVSSILAGYAPNGALLIAGRLFQGFSGAMIFATSSAIVVSVFDKKERGMAIGINTASVYIGLSAGPFFGGILTAALGWRSLFLLTAMLGALILPVIILRMKGEWAESAGESIDVPGGLIYAAALTALVLGFSMLPRLPGIVLTAFGVLGIAAFIFFESRVDQPILDVKLFSGNPAFAFSNLAALLSYSATFSVVFFMSFYLQVVRGMSPQHAGFVLVAQPLFQAVFSPLAGKISDRVEPRIPASLGMGLTVAGLVLLAFLTPATPVSWVVFCLSLLGFGFALFSSPNTHAVMSSVDKRFLGVASATLGSMRSIGQMFSMGCAMLLVALMVGNVAAGPESAPGFLKAMKAGFVLSAVLCVIGLFASLSRGDVHRAE